MVKRSFWTIMFIHIVVFTSIGLFTARGWRLLVIFLLGLVAWMGVHGVLYALTRNRPDTVLARYARSIWIFGRRKTVNQ